MSEQTKSVQLKEELEKNSYLKVFGEDNFPSEIKEGINNVMDIVANNKSITDLYPNELQEIPVSTSIFQDICVQVEQHHTSQRKLRQAIMELDSKLGALDSAKNNHKKAIVKLEQLKGEIEELEDLYYQLDSDNPIIDVELGMLISSFTYNTQSGESTLTHNIMPDSLLNIINSGKDITNPKLINIIKSKIKTALGNKIVDYEEAQRGLQSAQHMVKDAAVKAHQYQKQVDKYRKEVEESPYSYEEAEIVYYVMYFTSDCEKQLRTGDHQIDRGTYGAISQLPTPIRRKIQENVSFIRKKLFEEDYPIDGDYLFKVYEEEMLPKKTAEGEIEGLNVEEYLQIEPIKLISQYQLEGNKEEND